MKKFMEEFKTFALKGNVVDMAIGVIIGGAFTSIVNSLVNDIFTPLIGVITGGWDFSNMVITVGTANVMVGSFINAVISFLIVALCLFSLVKAMNKLIKKKQAEPDPAPAPSEDVVLLTEIRDLLKNK